MREFKISLEDVTLFARHGVFDFERKNGNEFVVNLIVKYAAPDDDTIIKDSLETTVCYAALFEIIREEMSHPRNLLETVAASIASKIKENFPEVFFIECKITKLHPPIEEFNGRASVTFILDKSK